MTETSTDDPAAAGKRKRTSSAAFQEAFNSLRPVKRKGRLSSPDMLWDVRDKGNIPLTAGEREMATRVHTNLTRLSQNPSQMPGDLRTFAAKLCGVARSSIGPARQQGAAAKKRPSSSVLKDAMLENVRTYVRERNKNGEHVSVERILHYTMPMFRRAVSKVTLWRWMRRLGFHRRRREKGLSAQRESARIWRWRTKFTAKMLDNHRLGKDQRMVVSVDESFIYEREVGKFVWVWKDDAVPAVPKGFRLFLVHAATAAGWVADMCEVQRCKSSKDDYHQNMSADVWEPWFERLCLTLRDTYGEACLIILDNASYHKRQVKESIVPSKMRKAECMAFLDEHHVKYSPKTKVKELQAMVRQHAPEPVYRADEIAKKYGHEIAWNAPYCPSYNPIERLWAVTKEVVRREFSQANTHTAADVRKRVLQVWAEMEVTAFEGCFRKSLQEWQKDNPKAAKAPKTVTATDGNDTDDSEKIVVIT